MVKKLYFIFDIFYVKTGIKNISTSWLECLNIWLISLKTDFKDSIVLFLLPTFISMHNFKIRIITNQNSCQFLNF